MQRHLMVIAFSGAVIAAQGCTGDSAPPAADVPPAAAESKPELELPPGVTRMADAVEDSAEVTDGHQHPMATHTAIAEHPPDPQSGVSENPVTSEPPRTDPSSPPSPASAAAVIEEVMAFYAGVDGFRVTSALRTRLIDAHGRPLPNSAALPQIRDVIIQPPDRFSVRSAAPFLPQVVSDGDQLSALLPARSRYLHLPAPSSLAEVAADPDLRRLITTGPTLLFPFYLSGPAAGVLSLSGIANAELTARESLDGVPADRLVFESEEGLVWNLWVAAEGDPLLLQASVNRGTRKLAWPGRGEIELTILVVETLSDWELNPDLTDHDFEIPLPESALEVRDIAEFLSADD